MDDPTSFLAMHQPKAAVQLSMMVLILYDHLTTLDSEVEFVWRKQITLPQILFFVNRYLGDLLYIYTTIVTVSENAKIQQQTYAWGFVQSIATRIVIWSMQGIIILRVSIMFQRSRKILWVVLSLFAIEIISTTVAMGISLAELTIEVEVIPGVATFDLAIYPTTIKFAEWVPALVVEAVLLGLTLRAGYKGIARNRGIDNYTRPSLGVVFFRDSILIPFVAFVLYLFTVIAWKVLTGRTGQIAKTVAFPGVAACVLGPRLMLNLREAYYLPFKTEYDQAARYSSHFDAVEFQLPRNDLVTIDGVDDLEYSVTHQKLGSSSVAVRS